VPQAPGDAGVDGRRGRGTRRLLIMATIGIAIAGTGFMGPVHVEALRRLDLPVIGVVGSSPEKSRKAASAWGLPKAYASFDELLADRDVHAVHITTPNKWHFTMARDALRAGKHVLCEKPLAMTAAETAELVRIARGSGRAAAVNYNIRFYLLCLEVRERVRRGDLGEIFSVVGSYVQDWLLYPTDYNWRVLAEDGGRLRAVADIGTHWLDLVQSVIGLEIEAVCADLRVVHPIRQRPAGEVQTFSGKQGESSPGKPAPPATQPIPITTEDTGSILLRFRGGATGNLWVSQVTAGRKNSLRFEIAGSKNAVAWNSEEPNELWLGHRDGPNETLIRDPALLSDAVRSLHTYPGGHNEGFPDSFKNCFREFYQSIAAGTFTTEPTFPTFADGHREILLCEAILRSHEARAWVSVPIEPPVPSGD
jgi:predicted dehydrogenase